ncbi:6635_t:CDS:2 [Ambispora gerdemannii]|uniref:6635_t:CDS:1 n=1 Tax=Ambispora gerdemannii TaxID=144530 RepID=A0A9N9FNM5_9GLOM|nr:6635_t:CDS:2 [Ambispora gerdemannii]
MTNDSNKLLADDEHTKRTEDSDNTESSKRTDFIIFLPLIKDVARYADNVGKHCENAEYNIRVCNVLLKRVNNAADEVKTLRQLKNHHSWFFENSNNYPIFQRFVRVIGKIQSFIIDISQLQGISKYFHEHRGPEFSMDKKFHSLIREFEKSTEALTHASKGHLYFGRPKTDQNIEDEEAISLDIRDMENYIRIIAGGIADGQKILEGVGTVATLTKTLKKKENIVLFEEVLNDTILNFQHFHYTEVTYSKMRKYIRYDNVEVAFKEVEVDTCKDYLKKDVTILKKLKGAENLILFHGIIIDKFATFLVTEWVTESCLKDFYQHHRMDWSLQMQFALDIARGLTYLRSADILHHDIHSESIFITNGSPQYTAKIGNFGISYDYRPNSPHASNCIRYMAPEKLKDSSYPYDFKCEIYSFGILLWEIAEQRIPFQNIKKDVVGIRQKALDGKREPFSSPSQVPIEWIEIVNKVTSFDPTDRPTLADVFTNLVELSKKYPPTAQPKIFSTIHRPTPNPRPLLTIQDAINNHISKGGDRKTAYQIFCYYADLGDFTAKYWVGYYLYYNCLNDQGTAEQRERAIVRAAKLFKEAADIELPEAQLRYGHCLLNGEGVEKNVSLAVEYIQKAADNGILTAMYNIGCIYYNGNGVVQDKEKGAYYLRMATIKGESKAFEMCKEHSINML